ncbi:cyclic nucleotide-binding domain-containing protein [Thermodesulfobacteriota bacterium]
MATTEELKQIILMGYLTEEMLEKIVPIVDLLRYEEQDVIFKQGDEADRFYMLKRGKVLLEHKISDKIAVYVGAVTPGFSFGWSAMLGDEQYASDAVCEEPCEIFSMQSEKVLKLFERDHTLGYLISQRLIRIIKKRLDARTEQFVTLITHHPDMRHLF